ncbi:hypothetical protein Q8A67_004049 [Cirrhinus molitorella]|uniref:LRRN4 C-terminal-like protein n=1 Tax=Cirrhinus molitorella TaxID=172907 RepID=A0AA88QGA4_9TELE|nr:hypothetical protein Q8A67_004049 [Cirrhinus molitorella]
MLGCGRPVFLLLLIKLLNLSFVLSSSSSSSQNATGPRFPPSRGSDYYSEYDDITIEPLSSSSTVSEVAPSYCDYDLCVEHQQTCQQLLEATGCLCPGLSSGFTPPSPPHDLSLTISQDGKMVEVTWCAPTSIVTHYIVWVKGNDKVMDRKVQVEERKRAAVLKDVEVGARICVEAVNKGGASTEDDRTCVTFEIENPNSGFALKMGIIGGVVGLILLLLLGLLLWRHKTWQKSTAQPETEGVL